jgi:hypothetical protein
MSKKTIHQIREEFASAASGVLSNYHARRDEIRSQRQPEAGAYLDRLNDEQRMRVLREQMMEQLTDLTEESREAYAAEVEAYHDALSKRTAFLKESLFKVEDAGALSRAALATDTELGTLLSLPPPPETRSWERPRSSLPSKGASVTSCPITSTR